MYGPFDQSPYGFLELGRNLLLELSQDLAARGATVVGARRVTLTWGRVLSALEVKKWVVP